MGIFGAGEAAGAAGQGGTFSDATLSILTSKNKSYYDTNIKSHHHFYDEGSKELTDIHYSQIKLSKVPVPPKGKKIKNLEVVIRIQK